MSGTIFFYLFNNSHFSSTCCAENSSLITCRKTMAKGMQEQKGEERSVAKSKSTAMNLFSHVPTSSSSAKSPIASKSPGMPTASGKPDSRMSVEPSSFDAASILKRDCKMHTLGGWWTRQRENLPQQKKNQGMRTFPNLEPGVFKKTQWRRDPLHPVN